MKKRRHRFSVEEDVVANKIAGSERRRGMSAARARSVGYATVQKMRSKKGKK